MTREEAAALAQHYADNLGFPWYAAEQKPGSWVPTKRLWVFCEHWILMEPRPAAQTARSSGRQTHGRKGR